MDLREQIFAANDRPLVEIEVPEWGCSVFVRIGSAYEIETVSERMQKMAEGNRRDSSWRAWFLQQFLCDADGNRLFSGDDYKKLGERSFKVIRRLHDECSRINGLLTDDEDDEDGAKKKSPAEASDSGSDYL